jgi:6-phosphofructokinase 1
VAELVQNGQIDEQTAAQHPALMIAGLVGSIDNDMVGTDMTIGADSALHRIVEAIDAITSTAASHQRSFVVEVMGRHCGYLALMSAIAGGTDYVLIPESPPPEGWEEQMCGLLRQGRIAGRRDSIVVVAEGAQDRAGNPISCDYVRQVLQERLGEDTRVTILGHVQRGGTPSSFDRWMSTLLGFAAVQEVLSATPDSEPQLIGIRQNRIQRVPLMQCVEQTRAVAQNDRRAELRHGNGASWRQLYRDVRRFQGNRRGVTERHCDDPPAPPGDHSCGRTGAGDEFCRACRGALRSGSRPTLLGVRGSFEGLLAGRIEELTWGDVEGWTGLGGCELGTNRHIPSVEELYAVARAIETHQIEGLLVIGGWMAYKAAYQLHCERDRYPAFKIPMICLPATIDNNLPGSELSVGADSALNAIVSALDRVKQSAMAAKRCFVVETMGRYCGYLALMSGLAGGAERVYLHEEGVTLKDLQAEVEHMVDAFHSGRRLYLTIRNERANPQYTTDFMCALFEEEGRGLFDVRRSVLGHFQQGGNPSPYDRILATRLAAHCISFLSEQLASGSADGAFIGLVEGKVTLVPLGRMSEMVDWTHFRPKEQWWLELRPVVQTMAQSIAAEA